MSGRYEVGERRRSAARELRKRGLTLPQIAAVVGVSAGMAFKYVAGTPRPEPADIKTRIMSKVERSDTGCWLWTASVTSGGYARIKHAGRMHSAHRLLFEITNGPVSTELELDHLCRTRHCVNPAHLEPVTPRENTMRAPTAPAAVNAAKTECSNGHPFDELNTVRDSRGVRQCRACRRDSSARYRANVKARRAA